MYFIECFMTMETLLFLLTSFLLRRCEPIPCHGIHLWGFTISLMYTPHSVGPLWTSDQPDTETSLYLTTQHSRQTSMPPAKFEPTIPASERPQSHTLDKAATYNNSSEVNCLIDRTISLWQSTYVYSWFQIFALFCMLYVFFWVIPRRLNFICRCFGTLSVPAL
jgi:hypothetical protein